MKGKQSAKGAKVRQEMQRWTVALLGVLGASMSSHFIGVHRCPIGG